jgi:hypothetical protein
VVGGGDSQFNYFPDICRSVYLRQFFTLNIFIFVVVHKFKSFENEINYLFQRQETTTEPHAVRRLRTHGSFISTLHTHLHGAIYIYIYIFTCTRYWLPYQKFRRVGIATAWMAGIRFPLEAWCFSLFHGAKTSSGAHATSYPMGCWGFFHGGKAAGPWTCPHSPSTEVKNGGAIFPLLHTSSWHTV